MRPEPTSRTAMRLAPWLLLALLLLTPRLPAATEPGVGALGTYVRGPHLLVPGTRAALRIAAHLASSAEHSQPAGRVQVQVSLSGKGRSAPLFRGETDASGAVDAPFQVPAWPAGAYSLQVRSRLGAKEHSARHEVQLKPGARLLLQSDKPLYQPGQTLHLRVLALRAQDGRPLPGGPGGEVLFELIDPRKNRVVQQHRPLSAYGISALDIPLAEELLLGGYQARVTLPGGDAEPAELAVEVARYALPKFQVQVETERRYYGSGARVRLQVRGRYFHGKPVAGGAVQVRASLQSGALAAPFGLLRGKLDGEGVARLELDLPAQLGGDNALQLAAQVEDAAAHVERGAAQVPLSDAALQAEIVAEAGGLVAGVDNRVWVVAVHPDGTPAAGAAVTLEGQSARSDAQGVAIFSLPVRAAVKTQAPCPAGERPLRATVREGSGQAVEQQRCLRVAAGGLLVRADRAVYRRGVPIRVQVQAPGRAGAVYLDLSRERQLVSTAVVQLRDGAGEAVLQPDEQRFGTLALQAYHLSESGQRVQDARLLYIERDAALRVEVTPQLPAGQDAFRPGEPGRLQLRVLDARSGAGVQAALGVVMVDEALLALRPMPAGSTRTYFTLTQEARGAADGLRARPAGQRIEGLVEGDGAADEALRQEAAQILLAGAAPPWDQGWEVDPWQERGDAWEAQKPRLGQALQRHLRTHTIGERDGAGQWRYRADLLLALQRSGALAARDARDPWDRPVPVEQLRDLADLPATFEEFALQELNDRLTAIYDALRADQARLGREGRAVILTEADLQRLVAEGKLPRGRLLDPWGAPFRILERKRPLPTDVGGLRSRFVLASAGPDGVPGSRDDRYAAEGSCHDRSCRGAGYAVAGLPAAEAFAEVRGLCGCGYGTGGGSLAGRATHAVAVRMGQAQVLGGVGDKEDRVRSSFPETLLWQPELLTDAQGQATLPVDFADSITTWRLRAEAIAADGRLGEALQPVRVFQDFFVDLDLPPALTQHDEVAVPVAVHNYLKQPQRVELQIEEAPWFQLLSEPRQSLDLAPGQVGARHFRVRALGVGPQRLRVRARGSLAGDAIERAVEVTPDGALREVAQQGRLGAHEVTHALTIPADRIAGTSAVRLKLYPAMATHVVEGLESLLRVPSGCFEQTSSTTYPNALILDYLRRTGKGNPQAERRAREYLQLGYQRLLSFEVRGGGFSWFGDAPANQVLTAYGLEEFVDMAKVFPVDPRVIERTRRWLLSRQREDGSFAPDTHVLHDGVTEGLTADVARITAYIAVALQRSGARGRELDKARAYVERALQARPTQDPFTLVLAAELLGGPRFVDALWATRSEQGLAVSFRPQQRTPTYGRGTSGTVETTALVARLLLQRPGQELRADRAVAYLLGQKDTLGNWHSTQATIRTLQALLASATAQTGAARGQLQVRVDGQLTQHALSGEALQVLDLDAAAQPGEHRVTLRFQGQGQLGYQLLGRYHQPRAAAAPPGSGPLQVRAELARAEVAVGGELQLRVRVTAAGGEALEMPMVSAGLPPGFDVDREALEALVKGKQVEKFQVGPREVLFYLRRLQPGSQLQLPLRLSARLAGQVQVPPPFAYEYYQPELRAEGPPQRVTVR